MARKKINTLPGMAVLKCLSMLSRSPRRSGRQLSSQVRETGRAFLLAVPSRNSYESDKDLIPFNMQLSDLLRKVKACKGATFLRPAPRKQVSHRAKFINDVLSIYGQV
jgi:hypothetical protein